MQPPASDDRNRCALWAVLDARTLAAMRQVPARTLRTGVLARARLRRLRPAPAARKHMLTPMLAGRILQALDVKPGDQVLEVGTGSGYLSACLAVLGGNVQTLELHGELATAARRTWARRASTASK